MLPTIAPPSAPKSELSELQRQTDELTFSNALLNAISRAQSRFIATDNPHLLFDDLLHDLLLLTGSRFGFIGEIIWDDPDAPSLSTFSLSYVDADDAIQPLGRLGSAQMVITNLHDFPGDPLTSEEPVLVNNAGNTLLQHQVSPDLVQLDTYLSLPCRAGKRLVGLIGLANRPKGYDDVLINILRPIQTTCASVIEGLRHIHSRHIAEQQSRSSQARWQVLIENVLDGIITISEDGLIESFNPAATLMFGYSQEEVLGQNVNILMPPPYHEEHDRYLSNYVKGGPTKIIGVGSEVQGKRRNGTTFPLDLSVSEMWLDQRRVFIGIVRDITERREIDRLKQEFISSISHELRTPLTSIRGALSLLNGGVAGPLSDKVSSLIKIAHSNCLHLGRLVDDILDLEKLKSGKMTFNFIPLDLHALLKEAITLNQAYASHLQVSLELAPLPPEPLIVRADSVRLLQVLANFLSNAAKFSPEGSTVTVSAERHAHLIRVNVIDQGPGIPDSFRAHVFDKFAQADGSDRRKIGGTGLGLNIAKQIIQNHGGTIDFITPPEGGTIFYFELPEFQEPPHEPSPSHSRSR